MGYRYTIGFVISQEDYEVLLTKAELDGVNLHSLQHAWDKDVQESNGTKTWKLFSFPETKWWDHIDYLYMYVKSLNHCHWLSIGEDCKKRKEIHHGIAPDYYYVSPKLEVLGGF